MRCSKIISSFVVLSVTRRHIFVGIDSAGFNITRASSQYFDKPAKIEEKEICMLNYYLKQIICNIKVRRAPSTRHDNIDFKPFITKTYEILPRQ